MVIRKETYLEQFQGDPLVKKMINLLTVCGKKSKSEKILDKIFFNLQESHPGQVLHLFYLAVFNVELLVGLRVKPKGKKHRRTVGAKESYIPYFISVGKSQNKAIRALFLLARKKHSSSNMGEALSQEILDSALLRGYALEERYKMHSSGISNKRFYRYRWRRKLPMDPDRLLLMDSSVDKNNKKLVLEKRKAIVKLQKVTSNDFCSF